MHRIVWALTLTCISVITACAPWTQEEPPPPASATPTVPVDFPTLFYAQHLARGEPVYRIDPAQSLVVITVRRSGALARLGHDHVVASHAVQGHVAPAQERADVWMALDQLVVDEPALRAQAGLDTQPSAADIAGTRANMRDKVLEVQQFPFALIRVNRLPGNVLSASDRKLGVEITLHGVTRSFEVPAQVQQDESRLRVRGTFDVLQSDFGIAPFSVFGGALAVQDRLNLRFDIQAQRANSPQ